MLASNADEAAPKVGAESKDFDELGLKLATITPDLRQQFEIGADVKGVVIQEVQGTGAAADKNVRSGDVIVEMNQQEVTAPADVAAAIKKAHEDGKKSVLALVDRQGDLRFVPLPLAAADAGKAPSPAVPGKE